MREFASQGQWEKLLHEGSERNCCTRAVRELLRTRIARELIHDGSERIYSENLLHEGSERIVARERRENLLHESSERRIRQGNRIDEEPEGNSADPKRSVSRPKKVRIGSERCRFGCRALL